MLVDGYKAFESMVAKRGGRVKNHKVLDNDSKRLYVAVFGHDKVPLEVERCVWKSNLKSV